MVIATQTLESSVRKGFVWSALNSLVLRMGSLILGIILARILQPELFGVYALALTVQSILMTLADLGLSADLIRSHEPERIAPTVATLGLVSGGVLALAMATTSPLAAELLGSPKSADVIALLSVTLVLAGLGVVPYAQLNREFAQRKIFGIAVVDFVVSTVLTLTLIASGWGVISLAIGRIGAQLVTLVLQHVVTKHVPKFGWDRHSVRPVLSFGLPVAAANLLSWALLNVDNVAVSRLAGPMALGFYVLAFNISSWPMNALGQAVRAVALPGFAGVADDVAIINKHFRTALALTWAVSLPGGILLAALASPVIRLLYGPEWTPAIPVLEALGVFGALRAAFDLAASFLTARGSTGKVLWVQIAWTVALIPAMVIGVRMFGLLGAGWAHVVVGLMVAVAYGWALKGHGIVNSRLLGVLWPPILAVMPAAMVAFFAGNAFANPLVGTLVGGVAGVVVYALLIGKWLAPIIQSARGRASLTPVESADLTSTVTVVIPCYNYARFLPQAVESVFDQKGVVADVVIVDDRSTDNSLAVARELQARYGRVVVHQNRVNSHSVVTFNAGLELATGEFLVRLDADDVLTPGCLKRAVDVARAHPNVGLIYGHPLHFTTDTLPPARSNPTGWTVWPGHEWLGDRCADGINVITSPEVVMRKSVVDQTGGQRNLRHTHDMEMWFRLAAYGDVAYIRGADQAWHRDHNQSLSATEVTSYSDLVERHEAFTVMFESIREQVPDWRRLSEQATRTLANEALLIASHEYDIGRGGNPDVQNYLSFARQLVPNVESLPLWDDYNRRVTRGSVESAKPWHSLIPRLKLSLRNRLRWWRWNRNGTY